MKAIILKGESNDKKQVISNIIEEIVGKDLSLRVSLKGIKIESLDDISNVLVHAGRQTRLIVFDDCPCNLEFECFFPVVDTRYRGGDIQFKLRTKNPQIKQKYILVPYLIFITDSIDSKYEQYGLSFSERFEVIDI